MGFSYILMLTAFYVDNGKNLPLWKELPQIAFWLLPAALGIPLVLRTLLKCTPRNGRELQPHSLAKGWLAPVQAQVPGLAGRAASWAGWRSGGLAKVTRTWLCRTSPKPPNGPSRKMERWVPALCDGNRNRSILHKMPFPRRSRFRRWDERVAGSASAARQDSSLLLALMEQNLREQKSCLMQIFALVVGGCGDPAAVRKDAGRVQAVERVIKGHYG